MDTPQGISKVDQLSIVVRYAVITRSENGQPIDIEVKEVFLGFYAAIKHGAADLVNQVNTLFIDKNIDFKKCVGQGYVGASVMSGVYNGVQKHIKDIQPNADHFFVILIKGAGVDEKYLFKELHKILVEFGESFLYCVYIVTMSRPSRTRNQLSEEDKKLRRRQQKKLSIHRARAQMNEADLEKRRRHDRERYRRKKEQGKIKSIKDYTPRQQRQIRKIWREKAKLRREKNFHA
ncbi:unnamed protein product [Arctia plantaginis]|uniref:Uncharacterized protein n=1 Tax=Arctia plantaginis TaxID=874455 RepID=A0A8S0Z2Q3_ARCPL|nr:unnamed protein product [Arctia plantaginis]